MISKILILLGIKKSADELRRDMDNTRNKFRLEPANGRKCVDCGSNMALRKSKKGEFYGCKQYPNCRYTEDI